MYFYDLITALTSTVTVQYNIRYCNFASTLVESLSERLRKHAICLCYLYLKRKGDLWRQIKSKQSECYA